jgi:hypothetical protein
MEEMLGMETREQIRFFSFCFFGFMNGSALLHSLT